MGCGDGLCGRALLGWNWASLILGEQSEDRSVLIWIWVLWSSATEPGRPRAGASQWGGAHRGSLSVLGFLPQAVYKLKKACRVGTEAEQQGQLLTPEEVVDRIFLLVDENGDGNGQSWVCGEVT